MIRMILGVLVALAITPPSAAWARLQVFACEPEWAALTGVLGGDDVTVHAATTAMQDPHHVQARPSLIARLRQADLLVCTGAGLEQGWLPLLLRSAANPRVQPGRPGHFLAAGAVDLRDVPARLDRSHGDVHPQGNPHLHTDPRNIARVARALAARLATVDPPRASAHAARFDAFHQEWGQALQRWERRARPLRGLPVVTQHRGWTYLIDWLGLHEVATLEPKPGIPPGGAYLAGLLERLEHTPARLVLHAAYQDDRPAQWLAARSGLPVVSLPYTVGGSAAAVDLFGLFDDTLERLLAHAP